MRNEERIEIRLSKQQKEIITEIARMNGLSVSEYVRTKAVEGNYTIRDLNNSFQRNLGFLFKEVKQNNNKMNKVINLARGLLGYYANVMVYNFDESKYPEGDKGNPLLLKIIEIVEFNVNNIKAEIGGTEGQEKESRKFAVERFENLLSSLKAIYEAI